MIRVTFLSLLVICFATPTTRLEDRPPAAMWRTSILSTVARVTTLVAGRHGAYCNHWKPCKAPFKCDLFVGSAGLGIGVCKQQMPFGKPCGTSKYMCRAGVCRSGYGGTLCRNILNAGGVCKDPRATLCKYGLTCLKGVCINTVGYAIACDAKHTQCRRGFICAGTKGKRVCKVHVALGGYCDYENGVCYPGLACYGEGYGGKYCVRFLSKNQVCNGAHVKCNDGLKCITVGAVKRCIAPLDKGHVCGTPVRFCKAELTCHAWGSSRRCVGVMEKDQDCSGKFMLCSGGSQCVGKPGKKKCVLARGKGDDCKLDQFTYAICGKGLKCLKTKTGAKCYGVMAENGDCSKPFMTCYHGLQCVGDTGKQKCKKALPKGSSCVSPYAKCAPGLSCVGEGAERKCYGVMGYNGDCTAKFMACSAGLQCRGPPARRRCLKALPKGGVCDKIYRFCGKGLECTLIGRASRCASIMGKGQDCTKPYMLCKKGFSCVGPAGGQKQCWPKKTLGQKCDARYNTCVKGLACRDGHCVQIVNLYKDCSGKFQICKASLVCAKSGGLSKCVRPAGKGGQCARPFVVCSKELSCYGTGNARRCAAVIDLHGSCEGGFIHCKAGLQCVGPKGKRQCKKLSKKGGICGVPYYYCEKTLLCLSTSKGQGKCVGVSKPYDRCDGAFAVNMVCGPGTKCVGDSIKKCMAKPHLGRKCGSYYGECGDGQFCIKDGKGAFGICFKILQMGYKCEGKYLKCADGLLCAGIPGIKECRKPMSRNQRCDDPYWICATGLMCKKLPKKHYKWCL